MNNDSKVVSFERWQRQNFRTSQRRIFSITCSIFIVGLAERLSCLYVAVDDNLVALSERAENGGRRRHYINNLKYFRHEQQSLQKYYLQELGRLGNAFWQNKSLPNVSQTEFISEFNKITRAAAEISEAKPATHAMAENNADMFGKDFLDLQKRLTALLEGFYDGAAPSFFSPVSVRLVFVAVLAHSMPGIGVDVKFLICRLFERQVLEFLPCLYRVLNIYLARMSPPQKSFPLSEAELGGDKHSATQRTTQGVSSNNSQVDSAEQSKWRLASMAQQAEMESPASSLGYPLSLLKNETIPADRSERFEKVQRLPKRAVVRLQRLDTALGKHKLQPFFDSLLGCQPTLECWQKQNQQAAEVVKYVGLMFSQILADCRLSAPIKAVLATLQIPILKLATEEKWFLEKPPHPMRLLLSSLVEAGASLGDRPRAGYSGIYQKIKTIVDRATQEAGCGTGQYYELLEEFVTFMACEYRKDREAEERTIYLQHGKTQVRQAKRIVAYIIVSRFRSIALPVALRSFLCNVWKDVMVFAWLHKSTDPRSWSTSIDLMDELIASASCAYNPADKAHVRPEKYPSIKLVTEKINKYLEATICDPCWTNRIHQELECCYQDCLHDAAPLAHESAWRSVRQIGFRDPDFADLVSETVNDLRYDYNKPFEQENLAKLSFGFGGYV